MMDHYEELGLDRSASAEQIHAAYKRLVRLLHPDRCTDPELRRLAGIQMRRLNEIHGIILDPANRQGYDRSLEAPAPPRVAAGKLLLTRSHWLWSILGALSLSAAVAMLIHAPEPTAPPAEFVENPSPPASHPKKVKPASRLRDLHPHEAISQPDAPTDTPADPAAVSDNSTSLTEALPQAPALETTASGHATADPAPPPPSPASFAGEWFYVASSGAHQSGLYPPEFIELRIIESGGVLHGRYSGRYRVNDKAISPTVNFQFTGRADRADTRLPWSGPGGSAGEVTLRLLPTGLLEVDWIANHMGTELGLISGTAAMIRKLD